MPGGGANNKLEARVKELSSLLLAKTDELSYSKVRAHVEEVVDAMMPSPPLLLPPPLLLIRQMFVVPPRCTNTPNIRRS